MIAAGGRGSQRYALGNSRHFSGSKAEGDQVTPDRVTPDRVTPDRVTPDWVTPDRTTFNLPNHGLRGY